jgi:muramoyltetrapeptide carboxypeptidase
MSDITALHLFLKQEWHWPTIHGASAPDRFSPESIAALKSLLFNDNKKTTFTGIKPLNSSAQKPQTIESSVVGGNLSLVQAGIGSTWQLDGKKKIILLEDTDERGYRIDRMLQHLTQADIFKEATAILFGDFIKGLEPNGTSLAQQALDRFAESSPIPVVQIKGIGHDYTNLPLPLGTVATLKLGNEISLTV